MSKLGLALGFSLILNLFFLVGLLTLHERTQWVEAQLVERKEEITDVLRHVSLQRVRFEDHERRISEAEARLLRLRLHALTEDPVAAASPPTEGDDPDLGDQLLARERAAEGAASIGP